MSRSLCMTLLQENWMNTKKRWSNGSWRRISHWILQWQRRLQRRRRLCQNPRQLRPRFRLRLLRSLLRLWIMLSASLLQFAQTTRREDNKKLLIIPFRQLLAMVIMSLLHLQTVISLPREHVMKLTKISLSWILYLNSLTWNFHLLAKDNVVLVLHPILKGMTLSSCQVSYGQCKRHTTLLQPGQWAAFHVPICIYQQHF
mmetsp:Transcript_23347/g.46499  ORF Transcript_23347/g.46499 Transcript_23347/m.46499 type:complete len:200 (+) Transcript_23347:535-1134(+)